MIVSEIITEIGSAIGETPDNTRAMNIFNECLSEDLISVLRLETKLDVPVVAGATSFSSPLDLYELLFIKCAKDTNGVLTEISLDDPYSVGFKRFSSNIYLQEVDDLPDTISVYYYRLPAKITAVSETPDFPEQFHHALKYFYISKYQKEDEELDLEKDYIQEYIAIKSAIDEATRKTAGIHRRRKIRVGYWT